MMASMMVMATSERRGIKIKIDLPKIWLLYMIHNALSSRQLWGRGQWGWAHLSLKPPPSPSAAFSIRLIAKSKKKKIAESSLIEICCNRPGLYLYKISKMFLTCFSFMDNNWNSLTRPLKKYFNIHYNHILSTSIMIQNSKQKFNSDTFFFSVCLCRHQKNTLADSWKQNVKWEQSKQ